MSGPLRFLTVRSAINRLRSKAAQLRNPRYAVAFVLGACFLWLFVARHEPEAPGQASLVGQHRELVMAILVTWAVAWTWLFGSRNIALTFSLAEAEFLFASPLPRRSLIQFKLFHAQGRVLWSTLIWTFLLSRSGFGLGTWMHAGGVWILLSTLQLHRLGASLTRAAVRQHGRAGVMRRRLTLLVAAIASVVAVAVVVLTAPELAAAARGTGATFYSALDAAAARPLAHAFLAPFRLLVRPAATADPAAWIQSVLPALGLLLAHYVWVIGSDAAFEESAAEAARRRAELLSSRQRTSAAPTAGRVLAEPVFRLAATGRPAVAIYWKNLIAVGRMDRLRKVAVAFVIGAGGLAVVSLQGGGRLTSVVGTLLGTWAIFSIVIGPQWVRNDLRTDLQRLELLRGYPVSGAAIVAAEVAASATVLTLAQFILVILTFCAFLGDPNLTLGSGVRLAAVVGIAAALPGVNYLGLLLLNGGALLYPAWVRIGPGRASGVEGLGQNVLSMAAYAIALSVALVPPLIAGGAAGWPLRGMLGPWAVLPAASVALALVWVECRMLVPALGRVLERIDLASAGIEGG